MENRFIGSRGKAASSVGDTQSQSFKLIKKFNI
jgi:hypothetical protein